MKQRYINTQDIYLILFLKKQISLRNEVTIRLGNKGRRPHFTTEGATLTCNPDWS